MNRMAALLGGLLLAASPRPGAAALIPTPGAADPHIQTVQFDPEQVVVLTGRIGYELTIEFGSDERIENVAIGDASAWQVTPNRSATLLFVKPLMAGVATNMTVATDLRRYSFELTPGDDGGLGGNIPYLLKFRYPAAALAGTAASPAPVRNKDYAFKGAHTLGPLDVSDDGRFTYFRWAAGASIPAIFVASPGGGENLVNSAVRDGYIVVEQVAPSFILRNGADEGTVVNKAWGGVGKSRAVR